MNWQQCVCQALRVGFSTSSRIMRLWLSDSEERKNTTHEDNTNDKRESVRNLPDIRELKQPRRRRKRDRHLKMWLRVSAIIFQLFKVIMFEKCVLTILELNWNQRLGHKRTKLNICHHMLHVVHTTAKQVISRRKKNENVFKMSKDEKYTCKAGKNPDFHCQICKFVGFLLPSSSWLLKLPINK